MPPVRILDHDGLPRPEAPSPEEYIEWEQVPVVPAGAAQAEIKQTGVANLQGEQRAEGDRSHHELSASL